MQAWPIGFYRGFDCLKKEGMETTQTIFMAIVFFLPDSMRCPGRLPRGAIVLGGTGRCSIGHPRESRDQAERDRGPQHQGRVPHSEVQGGSKGEHVSLTITVKN